MYASKKTQTEDCMPQLVLQCQSYSHMTYLINFPVSILIRSNKMQQYAGIYLLQNYSTCFGCPSHPSSGVRKTVTAASGTGNITYPGNNLVLLPGYVILPVPEAAVTVLCTPDDGCDGHPKHVVNKYLHGVASCWILLI